MQIPGPHTKPMTQNYWIETLKLSFLLNYWDDAYAYQNFFLRTARENVAEYPVRTQAQNIGCIF